MSSRQTAISTQRHQYTQSSVRVTSKIFVRATRPALLCASLKTNILVKLQIKGEYVGMGNGENGWQKIPLLYGGIIRLRRYYCFTEGYSTYIGTASTIYCRRAKIIIINVPHLRSLTGQVYLFLAKNVQPVP